MISRASGSVQDRFTFVSSGTRFVICWDGDGRSIVTATIPPGIEAVRL
ncbi:MAG: hypothetical protein H7279_04960 [Microbacteriaceae bacterium]|nr:hypothetical protein [Microbacteriaceae bacterium]